MRDFFQQNDTLTNPFFVGRVEDNNDPTGNYRVKVRIPQIHHDNIKTENLPWAAKLGQSFLGLGGSGSNHCIPEIGSEVLLIAVGNNLNSLIYIGILCHNESVTPSGGAYGGTYGIYMANGQFLGVDKITQTLKLIYQGHIDIDKILDGKINISDKLDVTCPKLNITGDVNVVGEIHATKIIKSDTEVQAKSVTLTKHVHLYNPGPDDPTPSQPGQG